MEVTRQTCKYSDSAYSSTLCPAASPATNTISWDNLVHGILDLLLLGPTSLLLRSVLCVGGSNSGAIGIRDRLFVCLQLLGIRLIRRFRLLLSLVLGQGRSGRPSRINVTFFTRHCSTRHCLILGSYWDLRLTGNGNTAGSRFCGLCHRRLGFWGGLVCLKPCLCLRLVGVYIGLSRFRNRWAICLDCV